ncbi:MAG: SRPBCC family protein [Opitutus sp.]
MLTKILLALAVLLAAFLIYVALRPGDFHVARSVTVSAPPAQVFAQMNDLHNYQVWNPFSKADPAMKVTFEGPQAGPDAALTWSGNSQVGAGRMTIVESQPNERVKIRLDFIKPFPSTAAAEFTLTPDGNGTRATWSMSGINTFIPKAIGVFLNMDKMIGGEFERGLAEMKTIVERSTVK